MPTCSTCRSRDSDGMCRLNPPIVGAVPITLNDMTMPDFWQAWPHMKANDWCSQHKPKDAI